MAGWNLGEQATVPIVVLAASMRPDTANGAHSTKVVILVLAFILRKPTE